MKKFKLFIVSVIAIVCLVVSGGVFTSCSNDDDLLLAGDSQTEQVSSLDKSFVSAKTTIQGFLDAQYDYLIGKDVAPSWDSFLSSNSDPTITTSLKNEIDSMNIKLINGPRKAKIISYSSNLKTDDMTQILHSGNGDLIIDGIIDEYKLKDTGKLFLSTTQLSQRYRFVMIKEGGIWKIKSYTTYDIINPKKEIHHRWNYNPEVDLVSLNAIESEEMAKTRSISSLSDRYLAVAYAKQHYDNPSSNYPDYSAYGGDCTNFVSQCLEVGGWTQVNNGNRYSSYSWYHYSGYTNPAPEYARSASWTSASYLRNFFLSNPSRAFTSTSMAIGDIIQFYNSSDGWHHSTIVTSIDGGIHITFRNAAGPGYYPVVDSPLSLYASAETFGYWKIVYGLL